MSVEVVDLADVDPTPHADLFESEPKTIRLSLAAGDEIAAHSHPGRQIVFHLLSGSVTVELDGSEYHLSAGEVARFDGERAIAPRAEADSTAVIVLAPRADSDGEA